MSVSTGTDISEVETSWFWQSYFCFGIFRFELYLGYGVFYFYYIVSVVEIVTVGLLGSINFQD